MKQARGNRFSNWETAKRNTWINGAKLALVLLQVLAAAVVWRELCVREIPGAEAINTPAILAAYLIILCLMCRVYDAFQIGLMEPGEIAWSLSLAQFFTLLFLYLLLSISLGQLGEVRGFLVLLAVNTALNILWSLLIVRLYRTLFPAGRTWVICSDPERIRGSEGLRRLSWKFQSAEILDMSQGMDDVLSRLSEAQSVVLVDLRAEDRNRILKYCAAREIQVYIRPEIGDLLMRCGSQIQLLNVPVVHCGGYRRGMTDLIIKRVLDIVLSGAALVLLSPVMAVVAVLIRCCDGGPVLYRQVRLTQGGKKFEILKFRSMRIDAEEDGVARLATENDARITPVGRVIRAVRLDELPQLINILKGDMSIVGPRPERPELAEEYEKELPEFRLRLQAKAGLTGYAQVYGKYNTKPYEKLQMDLLYIARQSTLFDLKLMFLTVKVLFMKESTEGVEEEQSRAAGQSPAGK